MKVFVKSKLNSSAAVVWDLVERSSTLIQVAWPLARIVSVGGSFPEKWQQGETVFCRSYLFGFIPVGTRRIFFEKLDKSSMQLQSRETDPLIKRWDHLISVKPLNESSCTYSDEIEIDAGLITPLIWLWANWFYRHRQARWKNLLQKQS
jgi:hypothetical protein